MNRPLIPCPPPTGPRKKIRNTRCRQILQHDGYKTKCINSAPSLLLPRFVRLYKFGRKARLFIDLILETDQPMDITSSDKTMLYLINMS